MGERRANERYRVWFPVTLVAGGQESTAITYDVSASGGLLACPSEVAPGTALTLRFQCELDSPPREVAASVVRCEPTEDPDGPWRHRLAVVFVAAQPDLEAILIAATDE